MNPIAFAHGTSPDEFELFISENVEEVFNKARRMMPVRMLFDSRLREGLVSPLKYYRNVVTDEELEPGVQLEILLGDALAVQQYLTSRQVAYLRKKNQQLRLANQTAVTILHQVAQGEIVPEKLGQVLQTIKTNTKGPR